MHGGPKTEAMGHAPHSAHSPTGGPLSISFFRSFWIATVICNIGTCMKDVGAGWLMTSLSPSPLMVALVQTAAVLPIAVLSLPSGALADIFDRKRLLVGAQLWMMAAAAVLFIFTITGEVNALLLLIFSFFIACGTALSLPAFQVLTSEVVPRPFLAQAVNLGGIGNNIARISGPVIGGLVIAVAGAEWVFFANALSVVAMLLVLRRWKPTTEKHGLPPERLLGAMRSGFRYAHISSELHPVLVRSLAFFVCASSLWALLPLVARQQLGLGPAGYGLLVTSIGVGAILGGLSLGLLRRHLSANRLSLLASLLLAVAIGAVAIAEDVLLALLSAMAAGIGWNIMTASLLTAAQFGAASWVKARAVGMYLMVFQGSMAVGSILWGMLASGIGISRALLVASALLAAGLFVAYFYPLLIDPDRDFTPSGHWPDPILEQALSEDEGPVLVTIEYQVDPARTFEFITRLQKLRAIRLRDGAIRWRYWRDVAKRDHFFETFIVPSWLEHLRQHERVTRADRLLQEAVGELHIGSSPPLVRHWIAVP